MGWYRGVVQTGRRLKVGLGVCDCLAEGDGWLGDDGGLFGYVSFWNCQRSHQTLT
jgi:hypothetical protein